MQYPLHVTHFGHTQVLEEKRKPYLRRKVGGNSRWPSSGYELVSQLHREEETKQKDYKPDCYIWNLKPCVKKLSQHDKVMNTEQAQSHGEKQLQTISQKRKLL